MSKSGVAQRRAAATAIYNQARKHMDPALFGGCWRGRRRRRAGAASRWRGCARAL